MKRRIIAMSLAFVLAFSVFAGISLFAGPAGKETMAEATDASGNYVVVEIVPDDNYKTFQAACGATLNGKAYTVYSYTPDQLNDTTTSVRNGILDAISKADLFVINQTGTTGGASRTGYKSFYKTNSDADAPGADVCWEIVYEIFKRIAGVDGTPARYIMDASIYSDAPKTSGSYGFSYATSKVQNDSNGGLKVSSSAVYGKNITKLYLMLELMDPGTFYGVYFASHGEDYGIDSKTGNLLGYGVRNDKMIPEEAGKEYSGWSIEFLKPRFATSSSPSDDTLLSDIEWDYGYGSGDNEYYMAKAGDLGRFSAFDLGNYTLSNKKNISSFSSSSFLSRRGFAYNSKKYGALKDIYSDISAQVNSVLGRSFTIDQKQYRILAIDPNGVGSVNKSLIYDFMKYGATPATRRSFVGGIKVDNMSMYQYVGTTTKIEDAYDVIYLGDGSDALANTYRSGKLYGPGTTEITLEGKTYSVKYLNKKYLDGLITPYDSWETVSASLATKTRWGGSNETDTVAGLDLTTYKKKELGDFIDNSKKKVYYSASLSGKCSDSSKIASLISSKSSSMIEGAPSASSIITNLSGKLSVDMVKWPVVYTSQYGFQFMDDQNAKYADYLIDYGTTEQRYVNTKYQGGSWVIDNTHRTLDFKFYISDTGSGTYTAKLYVDKNDDGRFEPEEGTINNDLVATRTVSKGLNSWSPNPVADDYVGAVYWKLVISGNDQEFSYTGVSAYKGAAKSKVINIIQIVPVDNKKDWKASESSFQPHLPGMTGKTAKMKSTANTLLLPMKSEMKSTSIASYSLTNETALKNVEEYFNNKVKLQYLYNNTAYETNHLSEILYDTETLNKTADDTREDMYLANMGLFWYFMESNQEYDLNVLRLSTDEFETRLASSDPDKRITQLANGKFHYKNPDTSDTEHPYVDCDLLIMGLCRGMTPFTSNSAINALRTYIITKALPTYVGGGCINNDCEDQLTALLREALGQDRYGIISSSSKDNKQGYTYSGPENEYGVTAPHRIVRTNEASMTTYPYTIPYLNRSADVRQPMYQLALDGTTSADSDITVFYSLMNTNYTGAYGGQGDVINDYYIYKKGNITFCAFGFNEGQRGATSAVIKLPEAALIVNSIISSTNTVPNPDDDETPTAPNIVVTNPDRSEVTDPASTDPNSPEDGPYYKLVPEDVTGPIDPNDYPSVPYSKNTEYLYPDYDFDKANADSATNPELDLSTAGPNSYVYNNGTNNVIKVTFTKAEGFEDNASIKVTVGGETKQSKIIPLTDMELPVYYYSGDTKTEDDGTAFNAGTECFVEIPLDSSFYNDLLGSTLSNLYGIDKQENFKITIETIPEGYLYGSKTDVNIVKRGIFTIN